VVLEHLICRKTTLFFYVHFRWLRRNFAEEKSVNDACGRSDCHPDLVSSAACHP